MKPTSMSVRNKVIIGVTLAAALFFVLRLPGIHMPYHQDEWKNVSASMSIESAGTFFAHPPFMQMFFVASNRLFGTDNMRLFPLIFALVSVVLFYLVVKRRVDVKAAVLAVLAYLVCFYGILGSLQLDVDGSILPALFLLAVFAYDRLPGRKWLILLVATLLVGMLIKLNFILVIGAIVLDYLWVNRLWVNRHDQIYRKVGIVAGSLVAFGAVYVALLYFIQAIYPAFSISFMIGHANQFSDAVGRNWTQIIVQGVKAVYYLSPLLLVPLLWISKETIKRTRVFGLYLILGLIFYFVLFDFSRGALDKYLMFAIVPLAVMVGVILSEILGNVFKEGTLPRERYTIYGITLGVGVVITVLLVALNFLPQQVVALYPKTEWFGRVLHGQWNVLTPLNGGSGPLGFYISFLFIACSYIISLIVAVTAIIKKQWRFEATVVLILIGLAYNIIFAQELFFGGINGSAPKVLNEAVKFIAESDHIKKVMTFNDIGAGPLSIMGKYAGRIYATPESEEGYRKKFSEFDGDYLVVDMPRLYSGGLYYRFFARCDVLFQSVSGNISGKVYDCSRARTIVKTL
ncbi:MAG: glycosyltransferase family 39 protein [Candidatus Taylorbacteria bacterium]|nr:glycosyltransferase family 39 protein [Candidatus Taylorbacteria bacterium]